MERIHDKRTDSGFGLKTASSGLGNGISDKIEMGTEESPNMLRKE